MEVLINNEQDLYVVTDFKSLIEEGFSVCSRIEGLNDPVEVSVSFVDNSTIRELNKHYRGINTPTDVLSFPQEADDDFFLPPGFPRVLGDIVISLEQAAKQAEEYGHNLQREVVYLAVHGLLHLLGYDHETAEEKKIMRHKEEQVLTELDLGRE